MEKRTPYLYPKLDKAKAKPAWPKSEYQRNLDQEAKDRHIREKKQLEYKIRKQAEETKYKEYEKMREKHWESGKSGSGNTPKESNKGS